MKLRHVLPFVVCTLGPTTGCGGTADTGFDNGPGSGGMGRIVDTDGGAGQSGAGGKAGSGGHAGAAGIGGNGGAAGMSDAGGGGGVAGIGGSAGSSGIAGAAGVGGMGGISGAGGAAGDGGTAGMGGLGGASGAGGGMNPCDPSPCVSGATCEVLHGGGYACRCADGYYGPDCTLACDQGHCSGTVECDQAGANRVCGACAAGYYGGDCESTCAQGHCSDAVICDQLGGGNRQCADCEPGWSGPECEDALSCRMIREAGNALSGTYSVDVDGMGPLLPRLTYCDMDFDGGGWTLILGTVGGVGPDGCSGGLVSPGAAAFMPGPVVQTLAVISSQVHIRTTSDPAVHSITSVPNSAPIENLRRLLVLNQDVPGNGAESLWTGPLANTGKLNYSCSTDQRAWPSVYWACGNQQGLHLISNWSTWVWQTQNEPMEVYVR